MAKYRKKPVVIEATQWFKNGDHPKAVTSRMRPDVNECEGAVVRYYRHPSVPSDKRCEHCERTMHDHGWIDTLEGGHVVCPSDWIITGIKGELYPCKDSVFQLSYEPAEAA